MWSERKVGMLYEMQTAAGRAALARCGAAIAARDFDLAIDERLRELRATDPVLLALMTLRRFAIALPMELLARGWTPLLAGPDDPVRWKPPEL
jgi:hypothetical protein